MQWKSNGLSPYMMAKVVYYSLCEKCPYSEIFWSVFSGTGLNMKRLMLYRVLNYMLKVTDRSTRKRCEKWLKLTIKTPEQRQWYQPDIQIYWHLLVRLFLFAIRMWGFFLENCLRHLNEKWFSISGFSFADTDNSQDSRRREGTISFFSDIYLQLCMWDDYQVFLVASLVITRFRSRCSEVFCKKGVLRNFAKSTRKRLCQSLQLY